MCANTYQSTPSRIQYCILRNQRQSKRSKLRIRRLNRRKRSSEDIEFKNLKLYKQNESIIKENEILRKRAHLLHQENQVLMSQLQKKLSLLQKPLTSVTK